MLTSLAMFEQHLDCLASTIRFVSLDDVGDRLLNGLPFDAPLRPSPSTTATATYTNWRFRSSNAKAFRRRCFGDRSRGRPAWQIHDKLYHLVAKAFRRWDDPRSELAPCSANSGCSGRFHAPIRNGDADDPRCQRCCQSCRSRTFGAL
jgi:hypothetical protein